MTRLNGNVQTQLKSETRSLDELPTNLSDGLIKDEKFDKDSENCTFNQNVKQIGSLT